MVLLIIPAGPVFFASQLIGNLVIFWVVLGLESFTKEMQVGTYVVCIATVLLLRVGPGTQDDQVFEDLISKPWSIAWAIVLLVGMLATAIPLMPRFFDFHKFSVAKRYAILLVVRATAFAINLTTGRALVLQAPRRWIIWSLVIKGLSGLIYARAIVVQSTVVEQSSFVPLNAVSTLFVNAVTGIIIWEDWRNIGDWTGYVCVFLLFILGGSLLLHDLPLLSEADPQAFRPDLTAVSKDGRQQMFSRIKSYGGPTRGAERSDSGMGQPSMVHANSQRSLMSTEDQDEARKEAWRSVFHLQNHIDRPTMSDGPVCQFQGNSARSLVSDAGSIPTRTNSRPPMIPEEQSREFRPEEDILCDPRWRGKSGSEV